MSRGVMAAVPHAYLLLQGADRELLAPMRTAVERSGPRVSGPAASSWGEK